MNIRITALQREALADLATYQPGIFVDFGYGLGRYRVALRGLVHRDSGLVAYKIEEGGREAFSITAAGRAAIKTA